MKSLLGVAAVAVLCVVVTGCAGYARAPVVPPLAFIFTSYEAPLDVDFQDTPMPGKKGEASCINVLGFVSVGDASAKAAAEDGGITRIQHADYDFMSVLGVFSKFTTVVYGE